VVSVWQTADSDLVAMVRVVRGNRLLESAVEPGTKLRIAEVAQHASVSTATVSRVLNGDPRVGDEYRRRVLDAVAELNYRPNRLARNLRKQRSATIGVVVADIDNPHFSEAVRAVEDAAYTDGYRVLVCNTDENPDKQAAYLQALEDERALGVIISPSDPEGAAIGHLLDTGIPVVALDRAVSDPRADAVLIDNLHAARTATELLIASGHRDIALVSGPQTLDTGVERLAGYELVMRAAGLTPRVVDGRFRLEPARAAVEELLADTPPPSALFVANNVMALGTLQALRSAGLRVPDDVAVVAIDDPVWAALVEPPLTTMAQPVRRMALDAMELLLERVTGRRERPRRIVHQLELRLRASHSAGSRTPDAASPVAR
jgi:DNA-binding LacI/PurR family transcriptional regulator